MKKVLPLITIFSVFSISLFAQSETRNVSRFDEIHVSHGIQVTITEDGNVGDIYIRTENVDLDDIVTEVNRGVLRIKFNDFDLWADDKYDRRDVFVTLAVDDLYGLEINTGALVETENPIKSESIEIEISTGGEAEIEVETDKLRAEVSMGGILELSGTSTRVELKASMGSDISARDLQCEIGYVKASMGSEVSLTVLDEVEASAGMGAEITIYGDPSKVYTSDSFGGEIRIRDSGDD